MGLCGKGNASRRAVRFWAVIMKWCPGRARRTVYCLAIASLVLMSVSVSAAGAASRVVGSMGNSATRYGAVSRDYWPTDGWRTSTPEEQGMSSAYLDDAIKLIVDGGYPTDSFIVVRHGYVVCEEYWHGMYYGLLHHLQSAGKSITSILIGIAIDKGFIRNVSQRVVDFFPGWQIANLDSRKRNMTLWHLLTMTTGLAWDEWTLPYSDYRNSFHAMYDSGNWAQYFLNLPMAFQPGEKWVYCSGASLLLGVIIQQTSNYSVASFARKFLFDPIGVGDVAWDTALGGYYDTAGGLYMTPRDMAKVGYLMLNNGTWNGEEIVSAGWVAESTKTSLRQHMTNPIVADFVGYGYQWWTYPLIDGYFASGYGGQHIYVVPYLDLVVVFAADPSFDGPDPSYQLMPGYIYSSVLNEGSHSEKPFGVLSSSDMIVILCVVIVAAAVLIDVSMALRHGGRKLGAETVRMNRQ
ncbi:MAG: serine hydrolase [Promethearchaeati archaeon SRVP18_Atabeyarchaeia-1]